MRTSRVYTYTQLCLSVLLFCSQNGFSQQKGSVGVVDEKTQTQLQNIFIEFVDTCISKHDCDCESLFVPLVNWSSEDVSVYDNNKILPINDTHVPTNKYTNTQGKFKMPHLLSNGIKECEKLIHTPLPSHTKITAQVEYMSFVNAYIPNTVFGVAVIREIQTHIDTHTHTQTDTHKDIHIDTHTQQDDDDDDNVTTKEYAVLVSFYGNKIQFIHIYHPLIIHKDSNDDINISEGIIENIRSIIKSLQSEDKNTHTQKNTHTHMSTTNQHPVDRGFMGDVIDTHTHTHTHKNTHSHTNENQKIKKMFKQMSKNKHMSPEMKKHMEALKSEMKKKGHTLSAAGSQKWGDFKKAVMGSEWVHRLCGNATSMYECVGISAPSVFYDPQKYEGFVVTLFSKSEYHESKPHTHDVATTHIDDITNTHTHTLKKLVSVDVLQENDNTNKPVWQQFEPGIPDIKPVEHNTHTHTHTQAKYDEFKNMNDISHDLSSENGKKQNEENEETQTEGGGWYVKSNDKYISKQDDNDIQVYGHTHKKKHVDMYFDEQDKDNTHTHSYNKPEEMKGFLDKTKIPYTAKDIKKLVHGYEKYGAEHAHNQQHEDYKEYEDVKDEKYEKHEKDEKDEKDEKYEEHEKDEKDEKDEKNKNGKNTKNTKNEKNEKNKNEKTKKNIDDNEKNIKTKHHKHKKHHHKNEKKHHKTCEEDEDEQHHTHDKQEAHKDESTQKHTHMWHNAPCVKSKTLDESLGNQPQIEAMLTYFKINKENGLVDTLIMIPTTDSMMRSYLMPSAAPYPPTFHGIAFLAVLMTTFLCFIYALYRHSKKEKSVNEATPYLLREPTNNYHPMATSAL